MAPSDETVSSACHRLVAAGIDLTRLRTIGVDLANRDGSAIHLIALFGALRQGDLTVLFGVSKVTTSRLVARLIATERLHTSTAPDHTRGRPGTWLLLPGTMLPSSVERQAIVALVNDAAIVLQVAGRDGQLPTFTTAASAEYTSAAPTASAPPHCGLADGSIPSQKDASQLELPELPRQIDAACRQQPRSSAEPPQRPTAVYAFEVASPRSHPSPISSPTIGTDGDAPVAFPLRVHAAPAPPPSWLATTQQVWPAHGTGPGSVPPWESSTAGSTPKPSPFARRPASGRVPEVPPWQRQSSPTHGYGRGITRRIWAWRSNQRIGNRWTALGHQVKAAISWLLLHLRSIGRGIWHAFRYIGHGIWRAMSCLGAVFGWMSQCIAALHEMTDQRSWPAVLIIALLITGSVMFPLVRSINVVLPTEPAPVSAPPPTQVLAPPARFRWARVVGTGGVGLLIRNIPNGKRRLGDGLREGATVMVIAGPVKTADPHNPIWWHVRHNGVTGWASGRFLAFTDQAP